MPSDPHIARRELDPVAVEILLDERAAASVNSVLNADQESEARALARGIAEGLETGKLEPTAAAIDPFADRIPG